ncbi:hypothetical protein ACWDG1_34850 [Streptomyces sp. NPDC001177]
MTQVSGTIRNTEGRDQEVWPLRTRAVSRIRSACMVEGIGDFDPDDLRLVRDRFPGRAT